jgi:hypothetical protein
MACYFLVFPVEQCFTTSGMQMMGLDGRLGGTLGLENKTTN